MFIRGSTQSSAMMIMIMMMMMVVALLSQSETPSTFWAAFWVMLLAASFFLHKVYSFLYRQHVLPWLAAEVCEVRQTIIPRDSNMLATLGMTCARVSPYCPKRLALPVHLRVNSLVRLTSVKCAAL
jgi:hypothetical protein